MCDLDEEESIAIDVDDEYYDVGVTRIEVGVRTNRFMYEFNLNTLKLIVENQEMKNGMQVEFTKKGIIILGNERMKHVCQWIDHKNHFGKKDKLAFFKWYSLIIDKERLTNFHREDLDSRNNIGVHGKWRQFGLQCGFGPTKMIRFKNLYTEVIVNGDALASITSVSGGAEAALPPKTTEQKIAMRNKLKAKSTLLLAIPNEHLLKFYGIKDAKTIWEAIKTSQLEIHGEVISQEDANLKLLRSLPPTWNTYTLIMRNKSELDTLSIDDLYNNLKVYEGEIKGQPNSSSNSQNVAFVSSYNTSSTNEAVNTSHDVSAAYPQLDNEDLEQIDTDDLEEMDLKWAPRNQGNKNGYITKRVIPVETPTKALVVTDGMDYDWSYQAKEGPTNFALMAFSSLGSSSSNTRVNNCSKECLKSYQTLEKQCDQQHEILNKANLEIIDYQLGLESLEARIVLHQKNEVVFEEDIAFLKYDVKAGLGYDSQLNERDLNNKSDVFESASDSSMNESEKDNNQATDRYKADDSVFKSAISETVTSVHEIETSASKTSKENLSIEQNKPSHAKINFVKSDENTRKSVIEQHKYKQAENLRKSQNSRSDKRNWNGMITQKLRDGTELKNKACFVYGSLYHLIKDCNFYENKMVEKSVLNNKGKATGQRELRPVWNNAQKVNHQNFSNNLTHPYLRRCFVPTTVITNSCKVPVNPAKKSSPRAAASTSTAIYVNAAATRPTVNGVKSRLNGNPQYTLQGQRIFDNGCSRHMTGNKSFLTDYQEIDGGFVAFGGSCKGGKISRKGKIKTGKLDFEDVYFVKELKFHLFSVSRMCDKKNNVLFTETECLVLSLDFNLLDETQVLLKVHRQNNMKVEENMYIRFLENKSNVAGRGPEWLFDIDSLIQSMNYEPITTGNQTNNAAAMASEQFSSGPGIHSMTPPTSSSRLVPNTVSQQTCIPPKRDDWNHLFQLMFSEYFTPPSIVVSPVLFL
nr:ribonuclease H-like domain-containing protein [Tanacetum cinerariifolium]